MLSLKVQIFENRSTFCRSYGRESSVLFFLLTGYNTTTGRTDGWTVTDRQKCNTNIALCMLLLADFRQISFNKLQSALDIQSWSWVGSIHGLGWVGSEFFNFWWVGLGWAET